MVIRRSWPTPKEPYTPRKVSRCCDVMTSVELHFANHIREAIRDDSAPMPQKKTRMKHRTPRLLMYATITEVLTSKERKEQTNS